ncbi:MAG: phospholipid carrier-dependent glycosyltransferase [Christensenellales bacterium]
MICEAGLFDDAENRLEIVSVTGRQGQTGDVSALTDEQSLINTSHLYGRNVFDEIYHARTAYEHLHGMPPYENTHPPLGKVFIMLGVWLFGMNPFGWRIVGTLFGIGMLPLMYALAKRVTKSEKWAALATFLFAADGMHFVQTRIATIDVYGVFFIMAMCLCMMKYWQMNFYVDGLKKTFRPLGACGVLFGFAIARVDQVCRGRAGRGVSRRCIALPECRPKRCWKPMRPENQALCRTDHIAMAELYHQNAAVLHRFFILIPAAIYLLSYLHLREAVYAVRRVGCADVYV